MYQKWGKWEGKNSCLEVIQLRMVSSCIKVEALRQEQSK